MSQKSSSEATTILNLENTAIPLSRDDELLEALAACKDRLFAVIRDSREEVLLAALRNPSLDVQHLLALLKRRELGSIISAIYAGKHLVEAYAVKFALVAHPDTPSHIAQTLLPLLYIFDLLKLCQIPGVSADIRLAAERKIVQQIPTQPLGNKLTLARRGTAGILEALLRGGVQNVLEACLANPHLKEGSLHQFLASSHATAEAVSAVARNSRWRSRSNIRLSILRNPRTPLVWYTLFLPGLPDATVRDLLLSLRLTSAQKELVRQSRTLSRS
ncbi:MAG: hypothetical protein PHH91_00630 [Desulfuromonadaceae bacterium]|nr:hypothetical protein [Desulfuromonadaceae bacterium]